MSTDRNHQTVVIGAGLGGLCCGARLAKHGVPVTIVEQHFMPGGYAGAFARVVCSLSGSLTYSYRCSADRAMRFTMSRQIGHGTAAARTNTVDPAPRGGQTRPSG